MNDHECYLKNVSGKAESRCSKIIEVAYNLFLEKGYENVSMGDIVKIAGGSLATLYKHFGSKEQLFINVVEQQNKSYFDEWDRLSTLYEGDLKQFLFVIGKNFLELIITKNAVLFHRLIISVGYMNDSTLSENMMQRIMSRPTSIIASFLEKEKEKGSVYIDDTMLCAQQFLHAIKEPFMVPRLLGVEIDTSEERRNLALRQVVSIFYKGLTQKD